MRKWKVNPSNKTNIIHLTLRPEVRAIHFQSLCYYYTLLSPCKVFYLFKSPIRYVPNHCIKPDAAFLFQASQSLPQGHEVSNIIVCEASPERTHSLYPLFVFEQSRRAEKPPGGTRQGAGVLITLKKGSDQQPPIFKCQRHSSPAP